MADVGLHHQNSPVIEIAGLTKRYGPVQALDGVDLTVRSGAIYGFLGPNGAGKTTAIRILCGLLRASGGRAAVFGRDAWRESTAIRARLGYLSGDVRLYDWMTGGAFLAFCDRARGGGSRGEIKRLRERLDVPLERRVRDYSRGMKQKLALMAAMIHRPPLLILDEPTTSLDPLVRQTLFEELRAIAAAGRTVLLSSHTLSEVERLCDRVAIIRAGRVIEDGAIEALRGRSLRGVTFRLRAGTKETIDYPEEFVAGDAATGEATLGPARSAEGRDGGGIEGARGREVSGSWKGSVDGLMRWLGSLPLEDVTIGPPRLEDVFAAYYREGNTETPKSQNAKTPKRRNVEMPRSRDVDTSESASESGRLRVWTGAGW